MSLRFWIYSGMAALCAGTVLMLWLFWRPA